MSDLPLIIMVIERDLYIAQRMGPHRRGIQRMAMQSARFRTD
jgi:hypothetical protein